MPQICAICWVRTLGLKRWPEYQTAAGVEAGVTAFAGWVPSALRRFLPLAVFLTCLAEMVLLPTRFFFASAMLILLSKEVKDTGALDLRRLCTSRQRLRDALRKTRHLSLEHVRALHEQLGVPAEVLIRAY